MPDVVSRVCLGGKDDCQAYEDVHFCWQRDFMPGIGVCGFRRVMGEIHARDC